MTPIFLACFIIAFLKLAVGLRYDEHAAEIEKAVETEVKKPETKCKFRSCWISNHLIASIDYPKTDRFTYIVALAFIEKPKYQRKARDWYSKSVVFFAITFIFTISQSKLGYFKTEFKDVTGEQILDILLYVLIIIGVIVTITGFKRLDAELQSLKSDCRLHKLPISINSNIGTILKDSFKR